MTAGNGQQTDHESRNLKNTEDFHRPGNPGKAEAMPDAPDELRKPDTPLTAHMPESQSYYWTPEWQAKEERADADARLGRSQRYNSAEDAIAALNQ